MDGSSGKVYVYNQISSEAEILIMRSPNPLSNQSDCLEFLQSGGHIANHRQSGGDGRGVGGDCCPPVWDGFLCWPPAPPECLVEQPCPANIPQLNQHSKFPVRPRSFTGIFFLKKCKEIQSIILNGKFHSFIIHLFYFLSQE